ncbi:BhlA/UviB family holin-like peptide [Tepidimicrobium xylanilyticum]|uniref:BhlA holin family protein n=1 Tax=Tepidimicrobium xylanilyticum TaxID=1123352 RepID=A0A1H2V5F2_9FIRM|nr:BhlA/UviB family holin-like peptide [Tepidimicrobium xylanilyticum]GMG96725.1 phage-like protein [Tepidimicrobium xylanilyticum]SDW63535.1 BhlA holin family protein [Tepidimicrobium xylanilyticum]
MENELIKIAASQGIWATLSIFLIFYILKVQREMDKKQDEREKSYQEIIVSLTEKFDVIEDIDKNVRNIKNSIVKFKNKTV